MSITQIPTDLNADRIAQAIVDKARVIDASVERDIEADKPVQPIKFYFDQCAAIIAGISDEHKRIGGK